MGKNKNIKSRDLQYRKDYRQVKQIEKRRNQLLVEFFSHKYKDQYDEAVRFYNKVLHGNEGKRDLTTTLEYKCWLKKLTIEPETECESTSTSTQEQEPGTSSLVQSTATVIPEQEPETETLRMLEAIVELEDIVRDPIVQEPEPVVRTVECETVSVVTEQEYPVQTDMQTLRNVFTNSARESGLISNPENLSIEEIDNLINQIVEELQQEDEINEVLNENDDNNDEGIELNIEDEIYMDIEPFDYSLEVDF